MKILIISHRIPYPILSGRDKVNYNLIRTLSTRHNVTLVVPEDEYTDQEAVDHIRNQCHRLITVPVKNRIAIVQKNLLLKCYRLLRVILLKEPMYIFDNKYSEVAKHVKDLCNKGGYDLIQVTGNIISWYLRCATSLRPHVMGPMDDSIESTRTKRLAIKSKLHRLIYFFNHRAILHCDVKASLRSDWVFFHSQQDLQRFCTYAGDLSHARVLPLAVESSDENTSSFSTQFDLQEPNSVIFVGGLGSLFNIDAVLFFYHKIFPFIQKKIPDLKFYIVGQGPPPEIKNLERDGRVFVTGKVPDVRPYIEKAAVCVAPIRVGSGFSTKVVEALRFGKPIVATNLAVQALWDIGKDVIRVKDNPDDFAAEVVKLLEDDDLRAEVNMEARRLYERSYAFDAVAPRTLEVYAEIEKRLIQKKVERF